MSVKKHKKRNIILGICYLLIVAAYLLFLVFSFIPSSHGEDLNFFGNSIYMIDSDAVVVDFSQKPSKGDEIICNIEGEKRLATVDSISDSDILILSATIDGETDYYTTAMTNGVVTGSIPAFGDVYAFLVSVWGVLFIILLPSLIILIYWIVALIRISRNNRHVESEEDISEEPTFVSSFAETKAEPTPRKATAKFDDLFPWSNATIHDSVISKDGFTQSKPASFDDTLSELKFKMAFQDTHEISKRMDDETIEEDNDQLDSLKEYGITTTNIEDGVEFELDPTETSHILLRLKKDGSLAIITDNYTANIDMEAE